MLNERFNFPLNMDRGPLIRVGIVVDFNPVSHTASVQMSASEVVTDAPVLGMYGPQGSHDFVNLNSLLGATVALILIEAQYHVLSTMPEVSALPVEGPQPEASASSEYESALKTIREEAVTRSFNPNRSTDLLAGDKLIRSSEGAEMGVFQGGIAKLKASPMAQFILGKFKDLARLIARRVQIFSDFGEIEIFHREGGRVGLEIRGGADLLDETHPTKGNWTALVTIGSHADDKSRRVFLETRDASGGTMSTFSMTNDGKVDVWCSGKVNISAEKEVNLSCSSRVNIKSGSISLN
jgi:hypothetical protein